LRRDIHRAKVCSPRHGYHLMEKSLRRQIAGQGGDKKVSGIKINFS
jgi:hypothetical protein